MDRLVLKSAVVLLKNRSSWYPVMPSVLPILSGEYEVSPLSDPMPRLPCLVGEAPPPWELLIMLHPLTRFVKQPRNSGLQMLSMQKPLEHILHIDGDYEFGLACYGCAYLDINEQWVIAVQFKGLMQDGHRQLDQPHSWGHPCKTGLKRTQGSTESQGWYQT